MGLGAFGGGIGAVQFLVCEGATVIVTDLRPEEKLRKSLEAIAATPPSQLHLGAHRASDFENADLIVVSPAVPRDSPWLECAMAAGVALTSEMNLFWERNRGRTVCVTGSNGKSTTTALLHSLLRESVSRRNGRCWLGGNIGHSLLPQVHEIVPEDWVVLELSSFQLEDLGPLRPAPDVAVVTNFTPNHLDRHGTLDSYRAAKQNLLRWQKPGQVAVLNCDDPDVALWPTQAVRLGFGLRDTGQAGLFCRDLGDPTGDVVFRSAGLETRFPLRDRLNLPGIHNLQNALAASAAALAAGAGPDDIRAGLGNFHGLPHRLELAAETAGRKFYNDSKATTPEAAVLALKSFTQPVVLLAGGYDKHIDLAALAEQIVSQPVRAAALMGETAPALDRLLTERDADRSLDWKICAGFDQAFEWAAGRSVPGDVVLLSPGCASYDWFENYEHRGDRFRELARAWKESPGQVT